MANSKKVQEMKVDLAQYLILEESCMNSVEDMEEVEKLVWDNVNSMDSHTVYVEYSKIYD